MVGSTVHMILHIFTDEIKKKKHKHARLEKIRSFRSKNTRLYTAVNLPFKSRLLNGSNTLHLRQNTPPDMHSCPARHAPLAPKNFECRRRFCRPKMYVKYTSANLVTDEDFSEGLVGRRLAELQHVDQARKTTSAAPQEIALQDLLC